MILTISDWKNMLTSACDLIKSNCELLSKIDSEIGDGDHGVTACKIAEAIENAISDWNETLSVKNFFENTGWKVMGVNGGASGPLWGNFLIGLSEGIQCQNSMDELQFKNMFDSALKSTQELSGAKIGDKTMMDALIPAIEAIKSSSSDIPHMLNDAASAAEKGAESTASLIAKFGRAKNLKEKAIGHKDPGAVTVSLFFMGMSMGLKK